LTSISDPATNLYTFQLDYISNGGAVALWDNAADQSNNFWDILWVTPSTIPGDLAPFAAAQPAN
jgi:hypothetical protein